MTPACYKQKSEIIMSFLTEKDYYELLTTKTVLVEANNIICYSKFKIYKQTLRWYISFHDIFFNKLHQHFLTYGLLTNLLTDNKCH